MSNEKLDLIERDAVLRMLKAITSHSSQPGWGYAEKMILSIPSATATGSKPSIDWSHVSPQFNWLAKDNDAGRLYSRKPRVRNSFWLADEMSLWAGAFTSFTPGTCDWKDSLIMRPGYKGE